MSRSEDQSSDTVAQMEAGLAAILPFRMSRLRLDYRGARVEYGTNDFERDLTHNAGLDLALNFRSGDRLVDVALPDMSFKDRQVVLMDDMVSTGHTAAQAARRLLAAGAKSVDVAVTHALFSGDAIDVMHAAGVGEVWSTDCITHSSNAVAMAGSIASALQQVHGSA